MNGKGDGVCIERTPFLLTVEEIEGLATFLNNVAMLYICILMPYAPTSEALPRQDAR
jgi:hypothetical protein